MLINGSHRTCMTGSQGLLNETPHKKAYMFGFYNFICYILQFFMGMCHRRQHIITNYAVKTLQL